MTVSTRPAPRLHRGRLRPESLKWSSVDATAIRNPFPDSYVLPPAPGRGESRLGVRRATWHRPDGPRGPRLRASLGSLVRGSRRLGHGTEMPCERPGIPARTALAN